MASTTLTKPWISGSFSELRFHAMPMCHTGLALSGLTWGTKETPRLARTKYKYKIEFL